MKKANKKGTAIHIGASKESVVEAKSAIVLIMNSKNTDTVKCAALNCLSSLCSVGNTSITNCTITTN
jgi:hypothetical protein